MKVSAVKGTRDFYPALMAVRNYLVDGWKASARRNGFSEYDGPIFEYLKMYQIKSGEEIVDQLFSLQDRGGRDLAIRPEITPTLARMVNQQINALPRPIKWFSVPRLCRAERPQKGRLREFFQWNIDIMGVEDVLADAEVIFCALDYLRSTGLGVDDIVVRISSRKMLAEILKAIGIAEGQLDGLYALLDKKAKLPSEAFEALLADAIVDPDQRDRIGTLMNARSLDDVTQTVAVTEPAQAAVDELERLFDLLYTMGVGDFCRFDISIVRGLAYYTGAVYEIYDRGCGLRALGGGGRYDNLLQQFGGPQVTGTGLGMGDCVLGILLEEKGLLARNLPKPSLDYFVACADREHMNDVIRMVAQLRTKGLSTVFSYKTSGLGKQLKEAADQGARRCIIVGQEMAEARVQLKDMDSGEQRLVDVTSLLTSESI